MMRRPGLKLAAALMLTMAMLAARGPSLGLAADPTGVPAAAPTAQPNVMKANVWAGPYGSYFNGPFTTVTICESGTKTCEKISGILIDTGSSGLRIFGQANHLKLATETASDGNPIAECMPFGTLSTWGRVAYADVKLGGEPVIPNLPIQMINPNYKAMPAVCKTGPPVAQNPAQIGYNGILGVGLWGADCGGVCATLGPQNPSVYFKCAAGRCNVAPVADSAQVQNPVARLPGDNNGVVLKMPTIPFLGAPFVSGRLVLGINTRSNNKLGGAFVYKTDDAGNIATTYNNVTMDGFIDSGSNALFFDNGTIPTSASAMNERPSPRLPALARRSSASDPPIGRAMPKITPCGISRVTMTQSPSADRPVRCALARAARSRPASRPLSTSSGVWTTPSVSTANGISPWSRRVIASTPRSVRSRLRRIRMVPTL